MGGRIVVGFLTRVDAASQPAREEYVRRVGTLCKRAEALGGKLCAFGSRSVAFEFEPDELTEAMDLAFSSNAEIGAHGPWRIGMAEGEMAALAEIGTLSRLAWGPPLVAAIAIARIAHPGEVLVDPAMAAVSAGRVRTAGARMGKDRAREVRGLVVDQSQPLLAAPAPPAISGLLEPSALGLDAAVEELGAGAAPMSLVRADPGYGGTRLLTEIEARLAPSRSLYIVTAGAEPLGALRHAFARSIALAGPVPRDALPPMHRRGLDRLLSGEGVDVRLGAELVARFVAREGERTGGLILVDGAMSVDDPTLDVVARVAKAHGVRAVVRLDASTSPPAPLQGLAVEATVVLGPMPRSRAEELVVAATQGRLSHEAARRWAKRGRLVPLGVLEALADGFEAGELSAPLDALGPPVDARESILRRLARLPAASRHLLEAVAVLGLEPHASLVDELLEATGRSGAWKIDELRAARWLRAAPQGFHGLPSQTHRAAILSAVPEDERSRWHLAASRVVERRCGPLASAEAARHAALAGDQKRAVEMALAAAKASRSLELEAATDALLAFAGASHDDLAPVSAPSPDFRLLSWIEALRSSGEGPPQSRLAAMASLAKGETSRALAVLREGVELAENAPPLARSRALLAYGIALAVAGRPTDALFTALDALARARESGELLGEQACARFLGKLTMAAGHRDAALAWSGTADAIAR